MSVVQTIIFIHMTTMFKLSGTTNDQQEKVILYELEIKEFNEHVRMFYGHGAKSLLILHEIGYHDTFYMHELHFYLPMIVDDTWRKYKLGIGIITIQGFAHHNKEGKNIFNRHTNHKGNELVQCMYRLWNKFYFNDDK